MKYVIENENRIIQSMDYLELPYDYSTIMLSTNGSDREIVFVGINFLVF